MLLTASYFKKKGGGETKSSLKFMWFVVSQIPSGRTIPEMGN